MISNKKAIITLLSVFGVLEATLGVAIQFTSGTLNTVLSYGAIVLAFIFVWLSFDGSVDFILTVAALFCTVVADLFLVVLEPMLKLPAMIFFSITQFAYFTRILLKTKSKPLFITHIAIRSAVSVLILIITAVVLGANSDAVALISLVYFTNLALNVIFAFIEFKNNPVIAIGLLLFLLCDFFVGMSMMDGYLTVKEGTLAYFIAHPGFNAAWVFYVPSQALIAASVLSQRLRKKHTKNALG